MPGFTLNHHQYNIIVKEFGRMSGELCTRFLVEIVRRSWRSYATILNCSLTSQDRCMPVQTH